MTAATEAEVVTDPAVAVLNSLAAITGMLAQLPRAIAAAVTQAQAQAAPQQKACPSCAVARMKWEDGNREAVTTAVARAEAAIREAIAAGQSPAAITLEQFLPPALAAAVPQVQPVIATVQGADCCAGHIPGAPGQSRLFVAQGPLSMAGMTALARR